MRLNRQIGSCLLRTHWSVGGYPGM